MTTVPASSDDRDSAVFVCQPSPLVLALIGIGLSPAEAIEIFKARASEAMRMTALELAL